MVTRRLLLTTGAAGVVILAGYGGYRVLHSDLSSARQPWTEAGDDFGDIRLNALSYAILAPNPHNRQPWLVKLDGEDNLTLYCDLNRLLPETDPPNRQITIGLGAFLEMLRMAAAEKGYRLDITPFPEGEPQPVLDGRPIAHITFVSDASVKKDPLFDFALDRRTIRAPFDQNRSVANDTLNSIGRVLNENRDAFVWTSQETDVARLKDICNRAWLVETGTKAKHQETTALTRIGEKEITENPDGISLSGPLFEATKRMGIITREKMNDKSSRAYLETVKFYSTAIDTSMAFGRLVGGNSRKDQLDAGASWARLQLAATREGLAMHPLSQALQEYPEMNDLYKEVHEFIGVNPPATVVQGLFRFGYADSPPAAPRWNLRSRLVDQSETGV